MDLLASACSTSSSDPRNLDGGVDFVDGATPPCEGDTSSVCVIKDGGVIIPTEDGGTTLCFLIQCDGRVTASGDCSDNDDDGVVTVIIRGS